MTRTTKVLYNKFSRNDANRAGIFAYSYDGWIYETEFGNRLVGMRSAENSQLRRTFTYNADGMRTRRVEPDGTVPLSHCTGQFRLAPGGMESKQFGLNLSETREFGKRMGQNTIVSAQVPNSLLNQLDPTGVDTTIFRSGTSTVFADQLEEFNRVVRGTIRIGV